MAKQNVVLIRKPGSPLREAVDQTLYKDMGLVVWQVDKPPLPTVASQRTWALWDTSGYTAGEARILAPALADTATPVVLLCPNLDEAALALLDEMLAGQGGEARVIGLVQAPADGRALTPLLRPPLEHLDLLREKDEEIRMLREELADRRIIERAKYALMFARGVNEERAYEMIRIHSRQTNQRMVEVARKVLRINQQFNDEATAQASRPLDPNDT